MYNNIKNEEFEKILDKIDIEGPAPIQEPERQYYFIKKARKLVKEKSERTWTSSLRAYRNFRLPDECQGL